jgi:long-chain fatty acid transport protein
VRQWPGLSILSCLSLCLCTPRPVLSAGFDYPAPGTAALGRGSAFTAKADDPSALFYNPGGVALLRGTHLLLSGNLMNENISFQRRNYPHLGGGAGLSLLPDRYRHDQSLRMPEIVNDDAPFLSPFFAITSDLGFLRPFNLVLMAGVYGPHVHPSHTFPRWCKPGTNPCEPSQTPTDLPSPARYDLVSTDVLVVFPTVGIAWQPIEGLSIGAHFQAAYASMSFSLAVGGLTSTEDPNQDADVTLDTTDPFTPTGMVGIHYKATPWLELGASLRFGFTLDFEGEISAELAPGLEQMNADMEPNPAPVSLPIPQPWVVRTGVRYIDRDAQERERFDVELDFVWESTSDVEVFDVATDAIIRIGTLPVDLQSIKTDHFWTDTWSLRLGGAYRIHDLFRDGALILRLGAFYQSPTAPEEYTRLDYLPFARVGLTAGVGVRWGRFELGVGYAHILHERREIAPEGGDGRTGACAATSGAEGCGSEVVEVVPLDPIDPARGPSVGNGTYEFSINVVTFGASAAFGGP